ncbi:MAG: hypothetical protein E6Q97_21105 [Desulfurellales bacterium]|nr:MAG: hypothetical protein E6Q97_21105 [Desulfurellales bacterium]
MTEEITVRVVPEIDEAEAQRAMDRALRPRDSRGRFLRLGRQLAEDVAGGLEAGLRAGADAAAPMEEAARGITDGLTDAAAGAQRLTGNVSGVARALYSAASVAGGILQNEFRGLTDAARHLQSQLGELEELEEAQEGVQALAMTFGRLGTAGEESFEQIANPARRLRAQMLAARDAAAQINSPLTAINDELLIMAGQMQNAVAKFMPMLKLAAGVGVGIAAVAAAGALVVGAFASAVRAWGELDKRMGDALRRLDTEWKKLGASIAAALLGGSREGAESVSALSQALIDLRGWVEANAEAFRAAWVFAVDLASAAALVLTFWLGSVKILIMEIADVAIGATRALAAFAVGSSRLVGEFFRLREELGQWFRQVTGLDAALKRLADSISDAFNRLASAVRGTLAAVFGEAKSQTANTFTLIKQGFIALMSALGSVVEGLFAPLVRVILDGLRSIALTAAEVAREVFAFLGLDDALARVEESWARIQGISRDFKANLASAFDFKNTIAATQDLKGELLAIDKIADGLKGTGGGGLLLESEKAKGGGKDSLKAAMGAASARLEAARAQALEGVSLSPLGMIERQGAGVQQTLGGAGAELGIGWKKAREEMEGAVKAQQALQIESMWIDGGLTAIKMLGQAFADLGGQVMETLGVFAAGGGTLKGFADGILDTFSNLSSSLGKFFVELGGVMLVAGDPLGLAVIAGGLALQGLAGFLGEKGSGNAGGSKGGGGGRGRDVGAADRLTGNLPRRSAEAQETTLNVYIDGHQVATATADRQRRALRLGPAGGVLR